MPGQTVSGRGPNPLKALGEKGMLSDSDKIQISETLRVKKDFGGEIWSGFAEAVIPLIIYNEGRQFLVGHPDPPDSWGKVDGDLFEGTEYYRSSAENTQAFAVKVGELWAGSLDGLNSMNLEMERQMRERFKDREVTPGMLKMFLLTPGQHVTALLHEAFHAFQAMHYPRRFEQSLSAYEVEERYPFGDEDFRNAWNEEGLLLAKAYVQKDGEEMKALVTQFLTQREKRRTTAGLVPELVAFEQNLEWLEGLGKYAEMRSAELAAAATEGEDKAKEYQVAFTRARYDMRSRLSRLGEQSGDLRFYLSGAVQAFLLDRLRPGWKAEFARSDISLESLLAETVDWPR